MIYNSSTLIITVFSLFSIGSAPERSFRDIRAAHSTQLIREESHAYDVALPPAGTLELVHYTTALGEFPAYLSHGVQSEEKQPAIIWLSGGFSNSISDIVWTPGDAENDQSASVFWEQGLVVLYPSLRGGNGNSGYIENCFGEVDDVLSAADFLASLPYVDADQIYLAGHSTGGTLALLTAELTDRFQAVYCLGPVHEVSAYGQDALNFDITDSTESRLRSPVAWRDQIKTPTYVFEGTAGNYQSLLLLEHRNKNDQLQCFKIEGLDHFAVIQPLTRLIADKVKAQERSVEQAGLDRFFPQVAQKREQLEQAHDTRIREQLVGQWHEDFGVHGHAIATFHPDGKYDGKFISGKGEVANVMTYSGTWSVEDSVLTYRLTEASDPLFLEVSPICNDQVLDINEAFLDYKSNDTFAGIKRMTRVAEPGTK